MKLENQQQQEKAKGLFFSCHIIITRKVTIKKLNE
jgi:hypothetical protein